MGEQRAVQALDDRGVVACSPVETIRTRRATKNGKREYYDKPVKLLPSYVVASSNGLDNALSDLAVVEDRKTITRKVGGVAEGAIAHIMARHGHVQDVSVTLERGKLVRLVAGAMQGIQARIDKLTHTRVYFKINGMQFDAPIEHVEAV